MDVDVLISDMMMYDVWYLQKQVLFIIVNKYSI